MEFGEFLSTRRLEKKMSIRIQKKQSDLSQIEYRERVAA
jgi:hypothetical protein